jgi:hypothetical protein
MRFLNFGEMSVKCLDSFQKKISSIPGCIVLAASMHLIIRFTQPETLHVSANFHFYHKRRTSHVRRVEAHTHNAASQAETHLVLALAVRIHELTDR